MSATAPSPSLAATAIWPRELTLTIRDNITFTFDMSFPNNDWTDARFAAPPLDPERDLDDLIVWAAKDASQFLQTALQTPSSSSAQDCSAAWAFVTPECFALAVTDKVMQMNRLMRYNLSRNHLLKTLTTVHEWRTKTNEFIKTVYDIAVPLLPASCECPSLEYVSSFARAGLEQSHNCLDSVEPLLPKDRAKIDWIHLVPFIDFDWTFHKGGAVVIKIDENDEQVTTRVDISLPLSMRNRVIPLINEKKEQEARRRKKATKGPFE